MIETYSFGKIVIDGKTYTSDVIIFPDRIVDSWWRKDGHSLCLDDISEIVQVKPEFLIVGQGSPGLMKVSENVREAIAKLGINLMVMSTDLAVERYNELYKNHKTVGAFHLTC